MKYKGYIGMAEFDEEAQVFFGRVVNTRDTITFQSENAKQLVSEFKASVDDYLDFCREKGRVPEHPYNGRFSLRLSPELHENLVVAAAFQKKSLNDFIVGCLANTTSTKDKRQFAKA